MTVRWVLVHNVPGYTIVLRVLPQLRLAHIKDEYPGDGIVHRWWVGPIFLKLRISISRLLG